MSNSEALQRGRSAFRNQAWREAYAQLSAADRALPIAGDDLELLATSAYLIGADEMSAVAWERAHHTWLREHNVQRAARCAFWMILQLLSTGDWARASGWLSATQRLLDDGHHDCPERGLLLVLLSRGSLKDRRESLAVDFATGAGAVADRFDDPELKVFSRLAQGLARARTGDAHTAATLFDEAMVAVTTTEVSPIAVGVVYCAVIEACYEILDVERAREWTAALSRWCGSQPDLVLFRGHCLVHRAETLRLCGDWSTALAEAEQACRRATQRDEVVGTSSSSGQSRRGYPIGAALYELAEIHRMRGNFAEAHEAYRQASLHGHLPEPGLALLRLAEGRCEIAATAIRRTLDQSQKRWARANALGACIDIMVRAHDLTTASAAARELEAMAADIPTPFLRALSAQGRGILLLAENEPRAAFQSLRTAWMEWQAIEAPYEAARVRVMMGLACRELGDEEAAEMEFEAARSVFRRLHAAPDVARVDQLLASSSLQSRRLTQRERQVIRLVAEGRTNRAIAHELAISERTVDRHVSNILTKLDLPSRTAVTAYAYQHELL